MATSFFTGTCVINEIIAVAIATPADGPSFGVAPQVHEHVCHVYQMGGLIPYFVAFDLTYEAAAEIDSFITSFKFPVTVMEPLPGIIAPSIVSNSPPYSVQAKPVTIQFDCHALLLHI